MIGRANAVILTGISGTAVASFLVKQMVAVERVDIRQRMLR